MAPEILYSLTFLENVSPISAQRPSTCCSLCLKCFCPRYQHVFFPVYAHVLPSQKGLYCSIFALQILPLPVLPSSFFALLSRVLITIRHMYIFVCIKFIFIYIKLFVFLYWNESSILTLSSGDFPPSCSLVNLQCLEKQPTPSTNIQ